MYWVRNVAESWSCTSPGHDPWTAARWWRGEPGNHLKEPMAASQPHCSQPAVGTNCPRASGRALSWTAQSVGASHGTDQGLAARRRLFLGLVQPRHVSELGIKLGNPWDDGSSTWLENSIPARHPAVSPQPHQDRASLP